MSKQILVTGGCGFIGSHTCLELLNRGDDLVVVDNLCNSHKISLDRVQKLTGRKLTFINLDLRNLNDLDLCFEKYDFSSVIHFAGLKAVGESNLKPLHYYQNNVAGTLNLLECMDKYYVHNLVFSSSATVYGTESQPPLDETATTSATNPYGRSKWFIEMILKDFHHAHPEWNIILLRYFNPIGAHASGEIGEDPSGIPNNLLPYISQVAIGKLEKVMVYGNDYPTPDGTGIRDYLHVVDLAQGHLKALDAIELKKPGFKIYNLGTGRGSSVMEVIHAFEKACGKSIPFQIMPRRQGDLPTSYAQVSLAEQELGWKAKYDLEDMCRDIWHWQTNNPDGFSSHSASI